ncbi:MAG: FAD-binding oxidoreductase [Microscillaceae bacterium]|jgi:glycine/D-amino acid oxidase-like deaminating enzyme|nr:FAD-binding oxidoreductase [Microscillaceae bacterium]
MKVDYLIIGQGIAGSVLAYTLIQQKKTVLVVDNPYPQSSSRVAAGICNPITGKRLLKTWLADDIFPFLKSFYQNLEQELGLRFLFEKPVYRTFKSIEDQNEWAGRSSTEYWQEYLNLETNSKDYNALINNDLGGWETRQSYHLTTEVFLAALRAYLEKKSVFYQTNFVYNDLYLEATQIRWQDVWANKVLFCEGVKAQHNPFFEWLPFRPVKGEWIKIKTQPVDTQGIINQGVFVLPLSSEEFQVGATYHWETINEDVSAEGRAELEGKLKLFFKLDYQIIDQQAGIRPATLDRRPFIGLHPQYQNIGIFNGFGAKGISLAPYFAQEFCNYLENTELSSLNSNVDIKRFYHLYNTLV